MITHKSYDDDAILAVLFFILFMTGIFLLMYFTKPENKKIKEQCQKECIEKIEECVNLKTKNKKQKE